MGLAGFALIGAVLLLPVGASRVESATNNVVDISRLYRNDIRAMAMGNSYVAVARGEGALQYNPAGLAQADADIKIELSGMASGSGQQFFDDTSELLSSDTVTATQLDSYLTTYADTNQRFTGQTAGSALVGMGSLNFGLGYGFQDNLEFTFKFDSGGTASTADDIITWVSDDLNIQYYAGAFAFRDGQMLLGVTTKAYTYETGELDVTIVELATGLDTADLVTIAYQGTGIDVGFIYRLESLAFLRGQWALNVLNAGGTTISDSSGLNELDVPMSFNFGMSISPRVPFGELLIHFELEDLNAALLVDDPNAATGTTQTARSTVQRSHYGLEYGIFDTAFGNHVLSFRLGLNRGLATLGFEINIFSGFRIVVAQFRDDLGNDTANIFTDTTTALQISLGFAF